MIINKVKAFKQLNKMKKMSFVWSCFVMTFFVACQQAEVVNPEAEDLRMSISASINGQGESPQSRYAGADPSNVDFAQDDAIGLFIDEEAVMEWVYDGTDWSTGEENVYWPDKTTPHTFHAFYPYAEAASYMKVPMPSLKAQVGRSVADISNYDFLVSTVSQSYEQGSIVSFEGDKAFRHVSTLLKLTFKGGGDLAASTLTYVTIEGEDIVAPSTYSFETGKVSLSSDETSDVLTVSGEYAMSGDQVFYLIVNEKTDKDAVVSLSVGYKTGTETYVATMDNFASNLFAGGCCQSYTITIKDSSLSVSGTEISSWDEGEALDEVVINGEKTETA